MIGLMYELLRSVDLQPTIEAVQRNERLDFAQYAALVHDALGFAEPVRTVPWLTPESNAQQVIGELKRLGLEHVLLVSHQPLVGSLVGMLEHGHAQQPAPLSTASLAMLDGDWPLAGLMTLRALHHSA